MVNHYPAKFGRLGQRSSRDIMLLVVEEQDSTVLYYGAIWVPFKPKIKKATLKKFIIFSQKKLLLYLGKRSFLIFSKKGFSYISRNQTF